MRNVLRINVVHQIFQSCTHGVPTVCPDAVVVVIDGDKPNSHKRQDLFQKVSGFQEVTAKPGQVFYDDTIHPASFYIIHHPLKSCPFKIGSGFSVVTVTIV